MGAPCTFDGNRNMAKEPARKTKAPAKRVRKPRTRRVDAAAEVVVETAAPKIAWQKTSLKHARNAVRSRSLAVCGATLTAGAIIGAILLR